MLRIMEQEDIVLGLAYLDKNEICDNFWSKLRSDNTKILN